MRRLLPISLLATLAACGDDPPPPPPPPAQYSVEVEVLDTDDNPVPRIPVQLDGKVVGYTDQNGEFKGTLTELQGKEVSVAISEIDGYRIAPGSEPSVTETLNVTQVGGTTSGVPIFMQVRMESVKKDYMVWVRSICDDSIPSGCGNLPVLFNGREVARTNHLGYAHFAFSDVPQNDVEIQIDTPKHDPDDKKSPMFQPRDPSYTVTLDLESHIYLLEETFSDPNNKKKPKKKRQVRKRPKKKKKKDTAPPPPPAGIDLFGN